MTAPVTSRSVPVIDPVSWARTATPNNIPSQKLVNGDVILEPPPWLHASESSIAVSIVATSMSLAVHAGVPGCRTALPSSNRIDPGKRRIRKLGDGAERDRLILGNAAHVN